MPHVSTGISEAQKLPDEIAASKVVKVAVNSGYPPMEMKDEKTEELTGFDIDLMAAMRKCSASRSSIRMARLKR